MIEPLSPKHRHEYPIVFYWYTKRQGRTIEWIIDNDPGFFEWVVRTFQDVTPSQAQYYKQKTGKTVPKECIQNVEPYDRKPGDPEGLYPELCKTRNLQATLFKYRQGCQMGLF